MRLSYNQKVRGLQVLNHIMVLAAAFTGSLYWWLGGILVYAVVIVFGIDIGVHRLFSHRSFQTKRGWEAVLAFLSVLGTVGSTIGWVGVHRVHHLHSDTEKDPHSPHQIGGWRAWVGVWPEIHVSPGLVKDLIKDPLHRFFHQNYFKILFGWILVLGLFGGFPAIAFLYCLPACLVLHATSMVDVPAHLWGYRSYETKDRSYNNWLVSLFTLGEGWHNNHHQFPNAHRHGVRVWEFDPPAFFIETVLAQKPLRESNGIKKT